MTGLLWQKQGIAVDADIQHFLAGEDVLLDRQFIRHDITASRAHAQGLASIHVLTEAELADIERELAALDADLVSGAFVLDEAHEDMHSAIESRLIERLGETGKKIHAGRSRNDQVLVATRLWLKQQLGELRSICAAIARAALWRAQAEAFIPLPGYTHLQRAMVSSTAMWWSAWAESFIDNTERARDAARWIDANPLGTAAGYGVNLPLERDATTQVLGFARLQVSPIAAQLSRGKYELAALDALAGATLDLRRLAWDLSLFTSAEFGFVRLPAQYTTGSSLMPNKRNPDVIELMRASHAGVTGARVEIEQLLSLPSGYHRDLQFSKGALVRGFAAGLRPLMLLPDLLAAVEWKTEAMQAALEPSMYATDLAIDLTRKGMPFRDAYRAAADPAQWEGGDPRVSLESRVSPGGHGDLRLEVLAQRLQDVDPHDPRG